MDLVYINTPACRRVSMHTFQCNQSQLSGLINFYRLQPELRGNGQANMLTTMQIHTHMHHFLSPVCLSVRTWFIPLRNKYGLFHQWKDKFIAVLFVQIQQLFSRTYLSLSSFKCTAVLIKSTIDFIDFSMSTLQCNPWFWSCFVQRGCQQSSVCISLPYSSGSWLWLAECSWAAEAHGCGLDSQ